MPGLVSSWWLEQAGRVKYREVFLRDVFLGILGATVRPTCFGHALDPFAVSACNPMIQFIGLGREVLCSTTC